MCTSWTNPVSYVNYISIKSGEEGREKSTLQPKWEHTSFTEINMTCGQSNDIHQKWPFIKVIMFPVF